MVLVSGGPLKWHELVRGGVLGGFQMSEVRVQMDAVPQSRAQNCLSKYPFVPFLHSLLHLWTIRHDDDFFAFFSALGSCRNHPRSPIPTFEQHPPSRNLPLLLAAKRALYATLERLFSSLFILRYRDLKVQPALARRGGGSPGGRIVRAHMVGL